MAFETTLDNTQEVIATVTLSKADGTDIPVTGLLAQVDSGDATFAMTADDGSQLPVNQIRLLSGPTAQDSHLTLNVQNAVRPTIAEVVLHVVEGVLSANISFGTPTPKPV